MPDASDPGNPAPPAIAIVGLAGRFPEARDCEEYWQNLVAGRECLRTFTEEEIAAAGFPLGPGHEKRVRARGVVPDPDLFDAGFFGYSPKEAEMMDPQQRVFLELAWEALESAGYDPQRPPGPIGVFAGSSINSYYLNYLLRGGDALGQFGIFPAVLLNEKDFLATRVAYKLDLRGPALTVQTACSTSLVAVCNACQSLLSYECDVALAGGIILNFPSCHSVIHEEGGMISADGHCRPFDKDASGTLFSDGAGIVVLRRLEDAIAAGDNILAVVRGFALNNDGADKAGYTAPSVNGQARVVQQALAFGDIAPDTISYVEAHGTATPLGDPIEVAALTQAFRSGTSRKQYCAIGSSKSNIGHLDVAAGIAGLIKTVLALQHRQIPPTINYSAPNPKIDFASSPFFVADRLMEWTAPTGVPRRAGVSSFGIGGTNAHVVLEEAPPPQHSGPPVRREQLLLVSGRTSTAVAEGASRLAAHLQAHPDVLLADVAFTLQVGRQALPYRRAIVAGDRAQAVQRLEAKGSAAAPVYKPVRRNPPVVFMFPGQGAQRINMGRGLYESDPDYRDTIDRCATVLKPHLGLDLRDVLYPSAERAAWAEELIAQTRITQPALFVTEYALASLWISWGVMPAAMIGHSVGEYVAACLAGVFSLEDGLRLIATRGRLIQELPAGSMLVVMAPESTVQPLLGEEVTIAAVNAPSFCVTSGPHAAIAELDKALQASGVTTRPLRTSHAFHSAMMQPAVQPFLAELGKVRLNAPKLRYASNVHGGWITAADATNPDYWARHLRQAVRFADGVATLLARPEQVLLEVGPGATLTTLASQHGAVGPGHVFVPSLPVGREPVPDTAGMLGALGRLWQAGVEIDWELFHAGEERRRVPLPTYPFERKRHFVDSPTVAKPRAGAANPAAAVPTRIAATAQPAAAPRTAEERSAAISRRVIERLSELSGLSAGELNATTTFLEMGFDSLFLSRVSRGIEVAFGEPVSFQQLMGDVNSPAALSAYLDARLPESWQPEAANAGRSPAGATAVATPVAAVATGQSELEAIRAQLQSMALQIQRLTEALLSGDHAARAGVLPLSDAQREIWLASQLGEDVSRTYNETFLVRISGAIDRGALRDSLQELVDRHDILGATFLPDGSGQRFAPRTPVALEAIDLTAAPEPGTALEQAVHKASVRAFDLARGPLLRFLLLRTAPDAHALLMVVHHVIADGWSSGVIFQELGDLYRARAAGATFPALPSMQYRDYLRYLDSEPYRERARAAERFWLAALADRPEEIELPSDRPRPPRKTFGSETLRHPFDPTLVARLREAARRLNCTAFHLLMASFNAWLHRLTGRDDLVVGVPTAGQVATGLRDAPHAERLVGHCVNMLPVRTKDLGKGSFRDLLDQVRGTLLAAREHQDVSLNGLIDRLDWPRDPSRMPLVSVSLNLARVHSPDFGAGVTGTTVIPPKPFSFFDLTVDVFEEGAELVVDCKFNRDLFDRDTVARWLSQWECLLAAAIEAPDAPVAALPVLPAAQARQLLHDWNATGRDYPRKARLHELVEQQVARTPDRPAITFNGTTLTYRELDAKANQLAQLLRQAGVGPDALVAVCVDRSIGMVVAMLAVLKAGGAYVPLDPAYPQDRIAYVLEDSAAAVLITEESVLGRLGTTATRTICLDREQAAIAAQPADSPGATSQATDLAYVIYTSGSTGRPKGVQIEHRAAVNFMLSMQREPGLTARDALLAITTLSFDIAGLEVFLPLISGARLVVAPRAATVDGFELIRLLEEQGITVMQATPATWRLLLAAGWKGRSGLKILCGGEPLPKDLAAGLLSRSAELWNVYGPTETTIWSTCSRVTDAEDVHIGRPIANTVVRIVDGNLRPVPIGVAGELLIGGDGLARGYLNRPELTAEKFTETPGEPGLRFYRTGDLARYRPDGNIACLGRLDFQVKVRGFRIELGEIEAVLLQHPDVANAVVVARASEDGASALVAYFVAAGDARPEAARLREHLARHLPDYMIPEAFVQLDALPTTPNGKIDRKALPAVGTAKPAPPAVVEKAGEAPAAPLTAALCRILAGVLGRASMGAHDDFFRLGGRSLEAVTAVARIRQELSLNASVMALFEHPTPAALAENLTANAARGMLSNAVGQT